MRNLALILALASCAPALAETEAYVVFSINVQDFTYPDRSAEVLRRIIDLHEKLGVPVDLYLTTTMVDLYEESAPDLLERLKTSKFASVSYHVRPPCPYYTKFDWAGLSEMAEAELRTRIREYETHGLDLASGRPTQEPGGYAKLAKLLGYAPVAASLQSDAGVGSTVQEVFQELGARMFAVHGRAVNLGDKKGGAWLRPEHYDLKLFQHVGEKASDLVEAAVDEARKTHGARAPWFVGVKMHDNDFFAEKSAWTTVYMNRRRMPPWDPTIEAGVLPEERQSAMWELYEAAVSYVAAQGERLEAVNAPRLVEKLEEGSAEPREDGQALLYLSGTMHIETKRQSWPDPDALIAFCERATAAGMRWSIGADIGWLEGEPRAAEVIRATEALGVKWDVHAHRHEDRASCAAAIRKMGGDPTTVASGATLDEVELLRAPVVDAKGNRWQAEVLWGAVVHPRHGLGSDLNQIGVWRPRSGEAFSEHDADGTLIAVGGGHLDLTEAEALATEVASSQEGPPVWAASVMVQPKSLCVQGTEDGIDAIEAWAARVSKNASVRWATIAETAEAWVAAGAVPSLRETEGDPAPQRPPRRPPRERK